ncbi:leucine-rich repeat extensin-like protein 5 [Penaeus monodon]|uniref:leucine-rich repeat extensin-like protein 5 n=1 Tax=Penaeus monodon TaxID=6687 RepID=UPI0018A7069B|nr:leucine-rich repeat extensin-like protein 5 [Penaeus monodon]
MPFIPFQRVQNIRKKTVIPASNSNDFRVEPYRSPDRRRRFTHRDWLMNQPNNRFATEYNSRYQESSQERQRRATRRKNDSGQVDKLLINPAYDDKRKSNNNDAKSGYHSDSGYSRTSYSRVNSTGGSRGDDTAKTPSSGGSVKLPQIRDSPLTAPDSATSVAGKGAAAPPVMASPGTSGDAPASATSRMPSLRARVQPQESSRWVEGKGSGCLRHFFPLFRPSAPKAEPTTRTPAASFQPPASSNRPSSPVGQYTSSSNQAPLRAGGSYATLTDPSSVSQRPNSPPSSPLQDSPTLSKEPSSLVHVPPSSLLQDSPPKQRTDDPVYTTCFSIAVPPSTLNASVPPANVHFKNTLNLNKDLTLTPNTLSPTADIPTDPNEDPAASPVRASPFLGRSSPPPRKDSPQTGLEPPPDSADSPPLAMNSFPVQAGTSSCRHRSLGHGEGGGAPSGARHKARKLLQER